MTVEKIRAGTEFKVVAFLYYMGLLKPFFLQILTVFPSNYFLYFFVASVTCWDGLSVFHPVTTVLGSRQ